MQAKGLVRRAAPVLQQKRYFLSAFYDIFVQVALPPAALHRALCRACSLARGPPSGSITGVW
jgi:hypothetical protein